jgi:geranylgeranyl pyrophosphate synthase
MTATVALSGLCADRVLINELLEQVLSDENCRTNGIVYEAMRYAVFGPGQRIRPILAVRVARMLNGPPEPTMMAAAAVELLHCASLIIDDLPCMDDAFLRRNRAAVHIQFGEAAAVLAAFGLVALSARLPMELQAGAPQRSNLINFQAALLRSLDCSGLIAGQAMDLSLTPERARPSPLQISEMKTVPLFKLAMLAGTAFSNLNADERALLNGFASELGLAFQISDDLQDGEEVDSAVFQEKLTTLRAAIAPFGPDAQELEVLIRYLESRVVNEQAK